MEIFELLKSAIAQKKKITYEYEMPKKAVGLRTGNPHIIFTSKAGDTNIAIYKTGGVKTDPSKPIPDWRTYKINGIKNVTILDDGFETAERYNPDSTQYHEVIAKI